MDQVVGMWLKAKSHAHPALSFVFTEESSSETRNLFQHSLEHIYKTAEGAAKEEKKIAVIQILLNVIIITA